MHRALVSTVDQVGRVAAAEGIDCDYAKGGSVVPVYSLMIATEPGGYVGDGVAAANLAGRCLAALITGMERELIALPWVGHSSRRWEPEPLRWLGVNAARWLAAGADRVERRWSAPRRDHA